MRCPCCGSHYIDAGGIRLSLDGNFVYFNGRSIHIRPTGAEILSVILENHPRPVHRDRILARVFPQEVTASCHRVHITNLRRDLARIGLGIKAIYHEGYVLTRRLGEEAAHHHVSSLKTGPRSIESRAVLSA